MSISRKQTLYLLRERQIMAELFADENSLVKNAQGFSEGDLLSKVKSFAKYDPNNPVESILAFLGPGILWMLGFRWFSSLYTLAEALGFNWEHIFVSIKEALRPLLHDVVSSKSLGDTSKVQEAVRAGLQSGTQETVDPAKLPELINQVSSASTNNLFLMKKLGQTYTDKTHSLLQSLLHKATGNRLRNGLTGFFVRVITWLILAVLIAVGFNVVGHTVASLLGTNKPSSAPSEPGAAQQTSTTEPTLADSKHIALPINPDLPSIYTVKHENSRENVWLLPVNVHNLRDTFIHWGQDVYPQLKDNSAFGASSAFQNTLQLFQDRNQAAQNLKFVAVPPPFTSMKDIVDSFAADVAAHGSQERNISV